jgi:hypothetical protein
MPDALYCKINSQYKEVNKKTNLRKFISTSVAGAQVAAALSLSFFWAETTVSNAGAHHELRDLIQL